MTTRGRSKSPKKAASQKSRPKKPVPNAEPEGIIHFSTPLDVFDADWTALNVDQDIDRILNDYIVSDTHDYLSNLFHHGYLIELWKRYSADPANNKLGISIAVLEGLCPSFANLANQADSPTTSLWNSIVDTVATCVLNSKVSFAIRHHLLTFMTRLFEKNCVIPLCKQFTSIWVLGELDQSYVERKLKDIHPRLLEMWTKAKSKHSKNDKAIEKSKFLPKFIQDLSQFIYMTGKQHEAVVIEANILKYIRQGIYFIIQILSQTSSRRFTSILVDYFQLVSVLELTSLPGPLNQLEPEIRALKKILNFPHDNFGGVFLSTNEVLTNKYETIQAFQKHLFNLQLLPEVSLASSYIFYQQAFLIEQLNSLDQEQFIRLSKSLSTPYDETIGGRLAITKNLIDQIHIQPNVLERVSNTIVLPTEASGHINICNQVRKKFLSPADICSNVFDRLHTLANNRILEDVRDVVDEMTPVLGRTGNVIFEGTSDYGLALHSCILQELSSIDEVTGKANRVIVDALIDLGEASYLARIGGWKAIERGDVLCLVKVSPNLKLDHQEQGKGSRLERVECMRTCQVVEILGDDSSKLSAKVSETGTMVVVEGRQPRDDANFSSMTEITKLKLSLDPEQYQLDLAKVGKEEQYAFPQFNLIVRLSGWVEREIGYRSFANGLRMLQQMIKTSSWDSINLSGSEDKLGQVLIGEESAQILDPFQLASTSSDKNLSTEITNINCHGLFSTDSFNTIKLRDESKGPLASIDLCIEEEGKVLVDRVRLCSAECKLTMPGQADGFVKAQLRGVSVVCGNGGLTQLAAATAFSWTKGEATLILVKDIAASEAICEDLQNFGVLPHQVFRFDTLISSSTGNRPHKSSLYGYLAGYFQLIRQNLAYVERLANCWDLPVDYSFSCEAAHYFYLYHVLPRWTKFRAILATCSQTEQNENDLDSLQNIISMFPFKEFFNDSQDSLSISNDLSLSVCVGKVDALYRRINQIFEILEQLRPLELLLDDEKRIEYILRSLAKIIVMTDVSMMEVHLNYRDRWAKALCFDNFIFGDSEAICLTNMLGAFAFNNTIGENSDGSEEIRRILILGNPNGIIFNERKQTGPSILEHFLSNGATPIYVESCLAEHVSVGKGTLKFYGSSSCKWAESELLPGHLCNRAEAQCLATYLSTNLGSILEREPGTKVGIIVLTRGQQVIIEDMIKGDNGLMEDDGNDQTKDGQIKNQLFKIPSKPRNYDIASLLEDGSKRIDIFDWEIILQNRNMYDFILVSLVHSSSIPYWINATNLMQYLATRASREVVFFGNLELWKHDAAFSNLIQ